MGQWRGSEKPSEGGGVRSGIRPEMRKQNVIVHIVLFSKIHLTVYEMYGTMGGEGGSKGGRKTVGGRKPLFAVLSRFYFRHEEIPIHGQKMERGGR